MASPIFLSEPPKSFSVFSFLRGVQIALFSVGKSIKISPIDRLFIIVVTSVSISLISNLPTMVIGTAMYILSLVKIISSETSYKITNYWIDYQCHVLDLMTLSFSLILICFPSIMTTFYASISDLNHDMGERLKSTDYKSLLPISRPKSSMRSYFGQFIDIARSLIPFKLELVNELDIGKLIRAYLMDALTVTLIHLFSKLPYIGGFISPIVTFSLTYPVCGFYMASLGTIVSIPSLLPRFLIPSVPRRMFSLFKTPVAGDQYLPETSFINILPLVLFLSIFRLLDLYLGVYFNKLPFTKIQVDLWIRSRSGVLIGYIITIYIISSFLGPFGFIGVYMGVAGLSELVINVTTPPPRLVSLESPPIMKSDDDEREGKERRSYSSSRLIDMQKLSYWIEKECHTVVEKKQYLRDIIEDFNRFID